MSTTPSEAVPIDREPTDEHRRIGEHVPRVLLTVEAAAEQLSISRTMMFALLKAGEVTSVRVGRLRRIPAVELEVYARRLVAEQCAA
jgi:excisionase family DNA binding protein